MLAEGALGTMHIPVVIVSGRHKENCNLMSFEQLAALQNSKKLRLNGGKPFEVTQPVWRKQSKSAFLKPTELAIHGKNDIKSAFAGNIGNDSNKAPMHYNETKRKSETGRNYTEDCQSRKALRDTTLNHLTSTLNSTKIASARWI